MTLSSVAVPVHYAGDDEVTEFDFPYRFDEDADLVVLITDEDGDATTQTLNVDYTVTGAGAALGGSITMTTPPADGERVTIYREVDIIQETDLHNQGAFFLQSLEDALDYLTMIVQQQQSTLDRCLVNGMYDEDPVTWDDVYAVQTASAISAAAAAASEAAAAASEAAAAASEAAAAVSEAAAADSETAAAASAAAALSYLNTMQDTWRGALASDPDTSLDEGDFYYNTTTHIIRVYTGGAWVDAITYASETEALAGTETAKAMSPATSKAARLLGEVIPGEAEFEAMAQKRRDEMAGSGFLEFGEDAQTTSAVVAGNKPGLEVRPHSLISNLYANALYLSDHGNDAFLPAIVNVDGYRIRVEGVKSTGSTNNNIVLPAAPDDIADRQDLIFLEAWHEVISEKDFVYPYGNVQYGSTSYNCPDGTSITCASGAFSGYDTYSLFGNWQSASDLIGKGAVWSSLTEAQKRSFAADPENNIYVNDEGELVQVRYRVRVIKGYEDGSWYNVDPQQAGTWAAYLGFNASEGASRVAPRGKQTPATDYASGYYVGPNTTEPIGDSFLQFNTGMFTAATYAGGWRAYTEYGYSGRCFALPIAIVTRRNQGAYHPGLNPNGSAQMLRKSGDAADWYDFDEFHEGSDPAAATLSGTVANGGWVVFYDTDDDSFTYYENTSGGDLSGAQDLTGANWTTGYAYDALDDCFTYASDGDIAAAASGRPDGLYHDEINERDVLDLRMEARPVTDLTRRLQKEMQRAIAGEIRGWEGEWEVAEVGSIVNQDEAYISYGAGYCVRILQTSEVGSPYGENAYIRDDVRIYIEGDSKWYECILKIVEINTYFNLHPRYGDVRSDFTASNTYRYVIAQRAGRPRATHLHCDIIGDPANYPQWIEDIGIQGTPLVILDDKDGTSQLPSDVALTASEYKLFKLSKKATALTTGNVLLYAKKKDGAWQQYTYGSGLSALEFSNGGSDVANQLTVNFASSYAGLGYVSAAEMDSEVTILVFYTTKGNPFALADGAPILAFDDVYAGNGNNQPIIGNMIGKVPIVSVGTWFTSTPLTGYAFTELQIFGSGYGRNPKHGTPVIYTSSEIAIKVLPYLTREDGRLLLQIIFKEMIYDSTWGDDDIFDIGDKCLSVADDNSNVVIYGQKRVALPAFIRDDR